MELYIFNKELELQGVIDKFQTLIWNRKCQDVGEFQLDLAPNQYNLSLLQKNYLLYIKGKSEVGIIQKINYKSDETKESLTIKGKFIESYLAKRINANIVNYSGTIENLIRQLVNDNCINPSNSKRKIPHLILGTVSGFTERVDIQDSYTNLITLINSIISDTDIFYKIVPDFENKVLTFELYKGIDRTSDNGSIAPTIFSKNFENIDTEE